MTNSGAVSGGKEGMKASGMEVMSSLRSMMSKSLDRNRSNNAKNHTIVMPASGSGGDGEGEGCDMELELELGGEIELELQTDLATATTATATEDSNPNPINPNMGLKPRLSAATKRKLKKGGNIDDIQSDAKRFKADAEFEYDNNNSSSGNGNGDVYKDRVGYMSYGNENEHSTYTESALQPQSHLRANEAQNANMIEQALLDVIPEDIAELNKKRKLMRWDAKKRKFVKVSSINIYICVCVLYVCVYCMRMYICVLYNYCIDEKKQIGLEFLNYPVLIILQIFLNNNCVYINMCVCGIVCAYVYMCIV